MDKATDGGNNEDRTTTEDSRVSLVCYKHEDNMNRKSSVGQQYLNVDLGNEQPVIVDSFEFEDDHLESTATVHPKGIDDNNYKRRRLFHLWEKCLHCFCPFFVIFRALCRCDMETFWKIAPPILVTKAFYSSCITLGLCTLFKVQRMTRNYDKHTDTINGGSLNLIEETKETYLFGLWTYTGDVETSDSVEDFFKKEVERMETCKFHMYRVDDESPDRLFLNDASFSFARALAISATVLGFFGMVSIYLTAVACRTSCRAPSKLLILNLLMLCGVFQSSAFLVFGSSVCRDTNFNDHRHCSLEEGAGFIFSSCFCYWFAAVASLKMPRNGENEECAENTKGTGVIKEFVDSTPNNDKSAPKGMVAKLRLDNGSEFTTTSEFEMGIINSDDETDTTISWDQSPYC